MVETLVIRLKEMLGGAFGDRLRCVVLYGSSARGDATPDSDVDVLVVLQGPVAFGRDLKTAVDALYPLQLELLRPIHAMPVDGEDYEAGEFALLRAAKAEGIAA